MADHAHQVLTELLVLRAQAGNQDAISLLVRAWQDRLRRHAFRLTGRDDAASDVTQDAWLDIARGISRLEDPAKFGPWAYRIVTRGCSLWVRRERRRRQIERTAACELALPIGSAPDTEDSVRVALRRLPADQRAILELRYVEEYSISQIAEALDIAEGTVKSRLFYAREHLRHQITKVTQ
jgi:RNA polymerase sigma-70 factor (ECF subfamily)